MDQKTQSKKWHVALFLFFLGLIFTYFIYFIATQRADPRYGRIFNPNQTQKDLSQENDDYLLRKNKPQVLGKMVITYRGIRDKKIIIDLVLLDLEPEYAYRRRIPVDTARKRFHLSDRPFILTSLGDNTIRIEPSLE